MTVFLDNRQNSGQRARAEAGFTVEPGGIEPPTSCMPCGCSIASNALISDGKRRCEMSRIDVRSAALSACSARKRLENSGRLCSRSIVLPCELVIAPRRLPKELPRSVEGRISRLLLGLPGEYPQAPGGVREVLGGELKARVWHDPESSASRGTFSKTWWRQLDRMAHA